MRSIFRSPFVGMALILIAMPLLASCAPDATAQIIGPSLGAVEVAEKAVADDIRLSLEPTPTPVVVSLATMSNDEIAAGLPEGVAAAFASADPAAGEQLALTAGCSGCHAIAEESQLAGPVWWGLGNRSITRAQETGDAGPAAYLYTSIANPNDYLVEGYSAGVMVGNYLETLSEEDFGTLIAYILEQQQE